VIVGFGFLQWWIENLWETLPERLRLDCVDRNALVARFTETGYVTLTTRRRGRVINVKELRTDGRNITTLRTELLTRPAGERLVLRVGSDTLLERYIDLPLAAEQDVERLLSYEMDRFTSFEACEVFWASVVKMRDRKRGRLSVRLSIVPRAMIRNEIGILVAAEGRLVALEAVSGEGLRVIPSAHGKPVHYRSGEPARLSIAIASILSLLVVGEPFYSQSVTREGLQAHLDRLQPQVKEFELLWQRTRGIESYSDTLKRQRQRSGDVLEALATISDVLPDDTYLTDFAMRDRRITLGGLSASAPRLIGLLAADHLISNPVFLSAVTRQQSARAALLNNSNDPENDVFSIQAELVNR
jgi:general secretion pathway protein L